MESSAASLSSCHPDVLLSSFIHPRHTTTTQHMVPCIDLGVPMQPADRILAGRLGQR